MEIERVYGKVLRKYSKNPSCWDRTPSAQDRRMVPLRPVKVAGPKDTPEMVFLATYGPSQTSKWTGRVPPKYFREGLKASRTSRARKTSQTWARKYAQGWDWHESRAKIHAGRPYYNMGYQRALDKGIQIKDIPQGKEKKHFSKAVKSVEKEIKYASVK